MRKLALVALWLWGSYATAEWSLLKAVWHASGRSKEVNRCEALYVQEPVGRVGLADLEKSAPGSYNAYNALVSALQGADEGAAQCLKQFDEVVLKAVDAYLDVVKTRRLKELADYKIVQNETIYHRVDHLYSGQKVTEQEMKQATSALLLAHTDYVVYANDLNKALEDFGQLFGVDLPAQNFKSIDFSAPLPTTYAVGVQTGSRLRKGLFSEERYSRLWDEINNQNERLALLKRYEAYAVESAKQALNDLRQKRGSLSVYMKALNEMINARLRLAKGLYDYQSAKYRLLVETGALVPYLTGTLSASWQADKKTAERAKALWQSVAKEAWEIPEISMGLAGALRQKEEKPAEDSLPVQKVSTSEILSATRKKLEKKVEEKPALAPKRQIRVVQLVMSDRAHRKECRALIPEYEAYGMRCYIKDSIDGVHIYLRCLPAPQSGAVSRLRNEGIDFIYTREDSAFLQKVLKQR